VTVNPYLGVETLIPFFEYPDRGVFALCRTSNLSADDFQRPGFLTEQMKRFSTAGLVVGTTSPGAVRLVRRCDPDTWMLCPGVGTQGSLDALRHGLREVREMEADGKFWNTHT